jgi:hypothetical protein
MCFEADNIQLLLVYRRVETGAPFENNIIVDFRFLSHLSTIDFGDNPLLPHHVSSQLCVLLIRDE